MNGNQGQVFAQRQRAALSHSRKNCARCAHRFDCAPYVRLVAASVTIALLWRQLSEIVGPDFMPPAPAIEAPEEADDEA